MGLAWILDTKISQSGAPLAGKETESLYSILFKHLPPQVCVTPEALAVPSPRHLQVIENYVDHPGSGLQQHTQSFYPWKGLGPLTILPSCRQGSSPTVSKA